jgi:indolepyruvate ferredoxin oxidoreductase, alpha subunit
LCPSFYKADVVQNPTLGERMLARIRAFVIERLASSRSLSMMA